MLTTLLAVRVDGRWQLGIGDPTVYGWLTVALYAAVAVAAARVAARRLGPAWRDATARCTRPRPFRWLWCGVALAMLLLAVNKQLDLQSWFTQAARDAAHRGGWYDQRRSYQLAFVVGLAAAWLVAAAAAAWALRRAAWGEWVATAGLGFLGAFIVLRASSFHHVHELMFDSVPGVNANVALEWTGIAITGLGAAIALRARPAPPPDPTASLD